MRQTDARRPAADKLRYLRKNLPQSHVLAAQNVALAGVPALKRQQVARSDVVDMDDVEAGIDVGRRAPTSGVQDNLAAPSCRLRRKRQ